MTLKRSRTSLLKIWYLNTGPVYVVSYFYMAYNCSTSEYLSHKNDQRLNGYYLKKASFWSSAWVSERWGFGEGLLSQARLKRPWDALDASNVEIDVAPEPLPNTVTWHTDDTWHIQNQALPNSALAHSVLRKSVLTHSVPTLSTDTQYWHSVLSTDTCSTNTLSTDMQYRHSVLTLSTEYRHMHCQHTQYRHSVLTLSTDTCSANTLSIDMQ